MINDNNYKTHLYKITEYALKREFAEMQTYIEQYFFQPKVFDEAYYRSADDFIFRMDITGMSYGQILKLSYKALQVEDLAQFVLGLKIIVVKLKGNQRYTYFDRDEIMVLMIEMSDEYGLDVSEDEILAEDCQKIPDILLESCSNYMPIGCEAISLEDYRRGSTRSIYDRYNSVDDKTFEKEFKTAVDQGNIYHYIVETDHFINGENSAKTKSLWIQLAKLLSAHYATEKAPWSKDLTMDLLRTYMGLKDLCEQEEFEDILFRLVTGTLKIVIKRIATPGQQMSAGELIKIINYLINVYVLDHNNRYHLYIYDLMKIMEKEYPEQDLASMKSWLVEQL